MKPTVRLIASLARPVAAGVRAVSRTEDLTILGWHRVDAAGGGMSTPVGVFEEQLDLLERWGAVVLPLGRAASLLASGSLPRRAVVLTFDDGYASVVETAWPLLRRRNMPATLFVASGYLDGVSRFPWDADVSRDDQVRLVDRPSLVAAAGEGFDVGSHTVTHPWLPHLSPQDLRAELLNSRATLEDLLGRPVSSLAYPTGGWNSDIRDAAAYAGYKVGLTVDRGANSPRQDSLALRRSIVPDTAEDLALTLDGAYTWLRPLDTWRIRKGPRW